MGKRIAIDLWDLGFRAVAELERHDPEELYLRLCALRGRHIDRCLLYVFRCAVYYARNDVHEPALRQWWSWKDGKAATPGR